MVKIRLRAFTFGGRVYGGLKCRIHVLENSQEEGISLI